MSDIDQAFEELAQFASNLVSEPIHRTLLVREIMACKDRVLKTKESNEDESTVS